MSDAEREAREVLRRWSDGSVFHADGRIRITINGECIDANREGVSLLKGITEVILRAEARGREEGIKTKHMETCSYRKGMLRAAEKCIKAKHHMEKWMFESEKSNVDFIGGFQAGCSVCGNIIRKESNEGREENQKGENQCEH